MKRSRFGLFRSNTINLYNINKDKERENKNKNEFQVTLSEFKLD